MERVRIWLSFGVRRLARFLDRRSPRIAAIARPALRQFSATLV
jgi:hypothetical protein